jgi:hypothetical protein
MAALEQSFGAELFVSSTPDNSVRPCEPRLTPKWLTGASQSVAFSKAAAPAVPQPHAVAPAPQPALSAQVAAAAQPAVPVARPAAFQPVVAQAQPTYAQPAAAAQVVPSAVGRGASGSTQGGVVQQASQASTSQVAAAAVANEPLSQQMQYVVDTTKQLVAQLTPNMKKPMAEDVEKKIALFHDKVTARALSSEMCDQMFELCVGLFVYVGLLIW